MTMQVRDFFLLLNMPCTDFIASNLQVRDAKAAGAGDVAPIPVTVRQLEALVRISESLARMELATVVQPHHVEQAIQLFASSTLDAVRSGLVDTQTFNDEQVCCRSP